LNSWLPAPRSPLPWGQASQGQASREWRHPGDAFTHLQEIEGSSCLVEMGVKTQNFPDKSFCDFFLKAFVRTCSAFSSGRLNPPHKACPRADGGGGPVRYMLDSRFRGYL